MSGFLGLVFFLTVTGLGIGGCWVYYEIRDRRHRRRVLAAWDAHVAFARSRRWQ